MGVDDGRTECRQYENACPVKGRGDGSESANESRDGNWPQKR